MLVFWGDIVRSMDISVKRQRRLRVIHLPAIVGGNPPGISRALNEIGVKSEVWSSHKSVFGYQADRYLFRNSEPILLTEVRRLLALQYVFRCDVVFFNFGSTLFSPLISYADQGVAPLKKIIMRPLIRVFNFYQVFMQSLELSLLGLLGRTIVVQYQGDDARQTDSFDKMYGIDIAELSGLRFDVSYFDRVKRKQIQTITRRASHVYALNPDLLNVLPQDSEFLPYSHVDLGDWLPFESLNTGALKVGHAPSNRGTKGTQQIIEAVDQLKSEGVLLELILIEGLPNTEAKKIYQGLDVMIDQLHYGWYGGLATELMALGKPVACFVREGDLKWLPEDMRASLPILRISKETLVEDLRRICSLGRGSLQKLGAESRSYVEKFHNPKSIAVKILSDIENKQV